MDLLAAERVRRAAVAASALLGNLEDGIARSSAVVYTPNSRPLPAGRPEHSTNRNRRNMDIIRALEQQQIREDLEVVNVGDSVKVHYKIIEGTRERTQVFQGVCIRKHGASNRETFTVRKISFGVGVERTFPVHSPKIDKIEVLSHGKVRRSKLYFLRDKVGKAARLKEKGF
jgi:large subunit ribosomal protein L19